MMSLFQNLSVSFLVILVSFLMEKPASAHRLGRFDIQLQPMDQQLPGFIFELKASRDQKENLELLAQAALEQIQEKQYETELLSAGVTAVIRVGIAFRGKEVAVKDTKI